MRYRYHNLLYNAHGAIHGVLCDPVRRGDGRCIVSRDKALVIFEDGTVATVIRRCLRLVGKEHKGSTHV
jgi:hypothetical protein